MEDQEKGELSVKEGVLEPSAHLLGYYQFTIVNFSCYLKVTANKLGQPLRYLYMCSYFDYELSCSKAVISALVSTFYMCKEIFHPKPFGSCPLENQLYSINNLNR